MAKIYDGLQLAFKVSANSLYGQCGAKTSPICKVELAASTTAIGRRMIMFSKKYIETAYKDQIVTLDLNCSGIYDPKTKTVNPTSYTGRVVHVKDSYCVYGDTDSVFIKFGLYTPEGEKITGIDAVHISTAVCQKAVKEISSQLKKPQNIEREKIIDPFILISKKRYHGRYYTKMADPGFYDNSMGIALKRRDNAPIVKKVFGGAIDIIMNERDIAKAFEFVKTQFAKILKGEHPLEEFIISKTLRSYYKKPKQIAHNVLASRQAQRDPGNRFEPNDRVPYVFIINDAGKGLLQGDRIETPDFIRQNKNIKIDYKMYITNQIIKPVSQIFELVPGYEKAEEILTQILEMAENDRTGNTRLDGFIKKKTAPAVTESLYTILKERREQVIRELDESDEDEVPEAETQLMEEIDSDDVEEMDDDAEGTSNYDDPTF